MEPPRLVQEYVEDIASRRLFRQLEKMFNGALVIQVQECGSEVAEFTQELGSHL